MALRVKQEIYFSLIYIAKETPILSIESFFDKRKGFISHLRHLNTTTKNQATDKVGAYKSLQKGEVYLPGGQEMVFL